MKLVEGDLKRLGDSTINVKNNLVKYTLIQVDDRIFSDCLIDRKINNFLQDGLNTTDSTKIWFMNDKKTIMAVQAGNTTRYYAKINPFFYISTIILLAATVWVGDKFGLPWFIAAAALTYFLNIRKIIDYYAIAAIGGTKV